MGGRTVGSLIVLLLLLGARAPVASAQSLGTFRWALAPFCNVITVTVTQAGGMFTLDGFDDQCGAATRASVVGTAFPNPDGTIGIGLSLVLAPGGAPVHVDVALSLATLSGPWRDSAGNTGTWVFDPAAPTPGAPRPPTGGLVSTVTAGAGLIGGGVTGAVSLNVNFGGSGSAASVARSDHTHAAAGLKNTGVGASVLTALTEGRDNTAIGDSALAAATSGSFSTAVGSGALASMTAATSNTAVGHNALGHVTTAPFNTGVGSAAAANLMTGSGNTIVGNAALLAATAASNNTAVGNQALANTTGSGNIAVGTLAGSRLAFGADNIYIGTRGPAVLGDESGRIRIGTTASQTDTFIAGIHGSAVSGATDQPVLVDSSGKLGTATSSARFKEDIRPLDAVSRNVLRLEPVSFRYTADQQRGNAVQYGLVAEQVADVLPELVIRDVQGRPFSVKYHVLPTLLLAEIQRLERERTSQAAEIRALREEVRRLARHLR